MKRFADFFKVSKFAAKLRAIELGFITAIGVLNYADGHYLPNFSFNPQALNKDETFIIDDRNATYEACVHPATKEKLDKGAYVYVDYVFCVDDDKYVTLDTHGDMILTDYARQHMDECCIKFKATHKHSATSGDAFYSMCALCRDMASDIYSEKNYGDDEQNSRVSNHAEQIKKQQQEAWYVIGILSRLPALFSATLLYHFENYEDENWKKGSLTEMELGMRTNYTDRQIRKFLNDENTKKEITATCALCIGLKLIPPFSEDLVGKSGHRWAITEEEYYYQRILILPQA